MSSKESTNAPLRVAVLASGSGTNFQAIVDKTAAGRLNARIMVVISNNRNAYVLERARQAGIRAEHWSETLAGSQQAFVDGMLRILNSAHTELIVLAGYMKLLPGEVVHAYEGRILNIHPALLPKHGGKGMYGIAVHEAVIAAGDVESGATVHCVDNEYDRGPIYLQRKVSVLPGDTPEILRERVLKIEHELLPEAISKFAAERSCPTSIIEVPSSPSRKDQARS
jgi:phosphoribosylglycinamide formyltransferase 1